MQLRTAVIRSVGWALVVAGIVGVALALSGQAGEAFGFVRCGAKGLRHVCEPGEIAWRFALQSALVAAVGATLLGAGRKGFAFSVRVTGGSRPARFGRRPR